MRRKGKRRGPQSIELKRGRLVSNKVHLRLSKSRTCVRVLRDVKKGLTSLYPVYGSSEWLTRKFEELQSERRAA
jgi:hypothetical protein